MAVKICPECGGKVAETRNDCIHCGYVFPVLKKCPECATEVKVNTLDNTSSRISRGKIGILPRTMNKEQFLERALNYLVYSEAPIDIFEGTFSEVIEEEIEIIVGKGIADVHYFREIGFDKQEQYVEEVLVRTGSYDKVDTYGNKYRREVKTKIVTDWKVDSGNIIKDGIFTVLNTDKKYPQSFINALKLDIVENSDEVLEEREVNEIHKEKFEILESGIAANVYYGSVPKIGDRQRNDKYTYVINNFSYEIYSVPISSIIVTHKGKTYKITSVAFGKVYCFVNEFEAKFESTDFEQKQNEISKKINMNLDKLNNFRVLCFACMFLFGIGGLCYWLFEPENILIAAPVSMIGVLSIIGFILLKFKEKNLRNLLIEYDKKFKKYCYNKKRFDCVKKLKEYNLPYSENEIQIEEFDVNCYEKLYKSSHLFGRTPKNNVKTEKPKKKLTKKKKLLIGILSVLSAVVILCLTTLVINLSSPLNFIKNPDGTYMVESCREGVVKVKIPKTYFGKPVTSIRNEAFVRNDSLTSVYIPEGVTYIGHYAFYGCNNLTEISIPESIEYIGETAFNGCDKLSYNEYDNCKYLGNNKNLYVVLISAVDEYITECSINEDTKIIYNLAFNGCSFIDSIVIPHGVISIGRAAFGGCDKLASVVISSSVEYIGEAAFSSFNNISVFCEISSESNEWDTGWNLAYVENDTLIFHSTYWAGQWEYDANGNPVPLS